MTARAPGPAVTLLVRADCHLCAAARDAVAAVCSGAGLPWAETDVDTDATLRAEYGDRVPVVLLDGVEHSYFTVDADRLRRALHR